MNVVNASEPAAQPMTPTETLNANKSPMMSFRLSSMSPSHPMPTRAGAPISAEIPSRVLAAAVLQPRSTSKITKCTDTPSVTIWRRAIAIERNQKVFSRSASFNVNCGSKDRGVLEPAPAFVANASSRSVSSACAILLIK